VAKLKPVCLTPTVAQFSVKPFQIYTLGTYIHATRDDGQPPLMDWLEKPIVKAVDEGWRFNPSINDKLPSRCLS